MTQLPMPAAVPEFGFQIMPWVPCTDAIGAPRGVCPIGTLELDDYQQPVEQCTVVMSSRS